MKIKMGDIVGVAGTNVRKTTGIKDVTGLAGSMRSQGLIHPIEVRPVKKGKYEVTVGQRRYLAAKKLGWREIEATSKKLSDAEAVAQSLAENIDRGDLSLEEEAEAYERLVKIWKSQSEVSRRTGIRVSHISEVIESFRLTKGLGLKAEFRPAEGARKKGEEVPFEHATMVKRALKAPGVPKVPKARQRELFKEIAPLPQYEARKVVDEFKLHPKEPITQIKERALPREYRYPDRTTIWLHRDTLKLLTQQSRMGDSYDDVIRRLLSGEGEIWVEVLAVDDESPAKHRVIFKLGNFYYEWNGSEFVSVEPGRVRAVVGA